MINSHVARSGARWGPESRSNSLRWGFADAVAVALGWVLPGTGRSSYIPSARRVRLAAEPVDIHHCVDSAAPGSRRTNWLEEFSNRLRGPTWLSYRSGSTGRQQTVGLCFTKNPIGPKL